MQKALPCRKHSTKVGAIINRTGSKPVYDCATTSPVFFIALCLSRESKQKVQPNRESKQKVQPGMAQVIIDDAILVYNDAHLT